MADQKKRILIVEDEKAMANALKVKLQSAGYEAQIALNGKEAIGALKESSFNLMLLDLMMPVMDGFAVLEKIKTDGIKAPPVLVSTNLSQPEDKERATKLGASGFFVKSNTPINEVISHVEKAMK